ncbi:MAG: CheF family chemotaxis protein [Halobacteriales archaeon]
MATNRQYGAVEFDAEAVISDQSSGNTGLVEASVALADGRLTFDMGDDGLSVPLERITDVQLGAVPDSLQDRFERGVRIRWRRDDGDWLAIVGGAPSDVDRFACGLVEPAVDGTEVTVQQTSVPNQVTDRNLSEVTANTTVHIDHPTDSVGFGDDALDPIAIPCVTGLDRTEAEIEGTTREVLRVRHVRPEDTVTTDLSFASSRSMDLLKNHIAGGCRIAIGGGPIRVLLVDDEPGLVGVVSDFLQRAVTDLDVETATTLKRATELLAAQDIECVVADFVLPNGTGLDLLETTREADPRIPFILFTRKAEDELPDDGLPAGVSGYHQKTVGTDQYETLARDIERIVAERRSVQSTE